MKNVLAVITGASRGIGAGIAAAAKRDGATVAACNRTSSDHERQLTADLADPAAWATFETWYGDLIADLTPDRVVFVHNAATLSPIGFAGEVDSAGYASNVLLNSAAPQVLGAAAIRAARLSSTPTVVVQLSSGAGKSPYTGWTSYCAAKAAVDMWVRTAGLEQGEREDLVRVLSIAPGVVATEMQAEIRASESEAFPDVDKFRTMYDAGQLSDPETVGARIWRYALDGSWDNGAVADVRELD